jgi:hypothetical protein
MLPELIALEVSVTDAAKNTNLGDGVLTQLLDTTLGNNCSNFDRQSIKTTKVYGAPQQRRHFSSSSTATTI